MFLFVVVLTCPGAGASDERLVSPQPLNDNTQFNTVSAQSGGVLYVTGQGVSGKTQMLLPGEHLLLVLRLPSCLRSGVRVSQT